MTEKTFAQALNEQISSEFAAHQAYLAAAIYYDDLTMPRMASFFYRQALEERNHALMIVKYLAPKNGFADIVEPVRMSLEQERKVTGQFNELTALARAANDFQGEQFLQWFLKEQVEEVSLMGDLLTVVERARDMPLEIEEFLAREGLGEEGADATAPPAAGGAI
jgi:bacterioferritin B